MVNALWCFNVQLSGQKQQIKLTLKTPGSNVMAPAKRSATGLPELPELNLVRRGKMQIGSLLENNYIFHYNWIWLFIIFLIMKTLLYQ